MKIPPRMRVWLWGMERDTGGRPQVVVGAKAMEAEVVDARAAMGVQAPSWDLHRAVVVVPVVVLVEEAVALVENSRASEVEMTMTMMMTLTSAGRWGMEVDHQGRPWPIKSHARWAWVTPQLTETCQHSISLVKRRELNWAIAYWIGLRCRRRRYMRQGCRGGW